MERTFELPVGLNVDGIYHRTVELLPTNGVAETVFTKKLSGQPFTWQGKVLAVAIKSIGPYSFGKAARDEFIKNKDLEIPVLLKKLSLADVNTCLVEIHRRVWKHSLKDQEFMCKFCATPLKADIDLRKIDFFPEDKEFMASDPPPDYSSIVVDLPEGLEVDDMKEFDSPELAVYKGKKYNRITFRVPTLEDGIRNEKFAEDTIVFWRRIAYDCLLKIEAIHKKEDGTEEVIDELPKKAITFMGLRLYDYYLVAQDLQAIREELMEYLPTLPFAYIDRCPCPRSAEIPFVMEGSNFFSV